MRIISERTLTRLHIEYDLNADSMKDVYDEMDKRFPDWKSVRSGPHGSKKGIGLLIADVNIKLV